MKLKISLAVIAALIVVVALVAQAPILVQGRQIYQETVEPDPPSSGYQIPWFDATAHIFKTKNSSNLVGTMPTFYSVAVLPPATGAVVGNVYYMTKATTTNTCPTPGDSGGSATAWCFANGTTYNPVIGLNSAQAYSLGAAATLGSATTGVGKAQCWKAAKLMGYCSTVVASDGSCTCN